MKLVYWSDYICPFCYVGITRMRKAIAAAGLENEVDIEMRSYELDLAASRKPTGRTGDRFAARYRVTEEDAAKRVAYITELGHNEGLEMNFATTQITNTLDAHRMTKLAHDLGNYQFEELCYKAYFTDNLVMADHDVLRQIAAEAGLPAEDVDRVLASKDYRVAVRADERAAYDIGVQSIPFFLVDDTFAMAGCNTVDEMRVFLEHAVNGEQSAGAIMADADNVCGPNGC